MDKDNIRILWEEAIRDQQRFDGKIYGKQLCQHEMEYYEGEKLLPLVRFWKPEKYPEINLAFSTRFGGVSEGVLSELNFGFDRGDTPANVRCNFKRISKALGIEAENLVLSDQIHQTEVVIATSKERCGEQIRKTLRGVDGLVTREKGLCLATSYADCVPLFFFDEAKTIVGASHAGWRGTVLKIGAKTVELIEQEFNLPGNTLHVVIGPSICQECYEVSEDVFQAFQEVYTDCQMEAIFQQGKEKGKYQLDLWAANYLQLCSIGIPKENIHVSGLCTCCHPKLFFSHRASKGKRGNLNGFISLRM